MKKVVGVIILVIFIVLISIFLFYNDFSNITKVEYQKYNHSDGIFSEVIDIEDEDTISKLMRIFNKANHQNSKYKKAYHENFKLTLFYQDGKTEIVRIWIGFGADFDLLESETRYGIFKLKNSKSRKALLEILK